MWIGSQFEDVVAAVMGDRPAPRHALTDEVLREAILHPSPAVRRLVQDRLASDLAAVDLHPAEGAARIRSGALAALAAAVLLEWDGPGHVEAARACVDFATGIHLAQTLAEDFLCLRLARRISDHSHGEGGAPVAASLRGLGRATALLLTLDQAGPEQLAAAGQWLGEQALPWAVPGRYPLRKLVMLSLCVDDPLCRLDRLGRVARALAKLEITTHAAHLVDLLECYAGWMARHGGWDHDARLVAQLVRIRDTESQRRQLGREAARFFTLLAEVDNLAKDRVRAAPQLHRSLLDQSRQIRDFVKEGA